MSRITIFLIVFTVINITNAMNFRSGEKKVPSAVNQKYTEVDPVPEKLNKRQQLIEKFRKKIGIKRGTVKVCHGPPQDYTFFFYEEAVGTESCGPMGLPYGSEVMRTFLEIEVRDPFSKLYNFHLYGIKENESVRRAEIHVQVQVVRHTSIPYPTCYIQVYQVLPNMSLDNPKLHRLIMSRRSNADSFLREPLVVTPLARSWVSGESPNLGVLIVTSCNPGCELLTRHRNDNEPEDQAMFVLFNNYNTDASNNQYNDNRKKRHIVEQHEGLGHVLADETTYANRKKCEFSPKRRQITSEEVYKILKERNKPKPSGDKKDELEIQRTSSTESTGSRSKREISNSWKNGSYERYNASIHPCDRHDMHIDFEELGIQLIGPKSYNAYQCLGHCKNQEFTDTLYFKMQEIIYRRQEVETRDRCCAPKKMARIIAAYCDRKGQAVLRYLPNMVVTSCSCRNNDNE